MMRNHRIGGFLLSALGMACLAAAPVHGDGAHLPLLISPTAHDGEAALVAPCPTLSWSGAEGSTSYRVQILGGIESHRGVVAEAEVGDARSWTPAGCLEEGREYAWRVGGISDRGIVSWSHAAPFRVVAQDSLRAALEGAARRLAAESRLTGEELDWLRQSGTLGAALPPPAASPPPLATGSPVGPTAARLHASGDASVHVRDENGNGVVALGQSYGIYAEAFDPAGAVVGRATGGGQNKGVYGWNRNAIDGGSPDDTVVVGVRGTGTAIGVKGTSVAPLGRGVQGRNEFGLGEGRGVVGESASIAGKGVEGRAIGSGGTHYGVRADASGGAADFYAAGAGADYGPFTGSHLVRIADDTPGILPGMVVSVTGRVEALRNPDGSIHLSTTLPSIHLTKTANDPAVLGAFVAEVQLEPDHPWSLGEGRIGAVNALGEGRLWVTDANGPVTAGDYLTSSDIPGYAQRQDAPELRASTVAKAIETVDWSAAERITVGQQTIRAMLVAVVYTGG